jgi:hypothetical protein
MMRAKVLERTLVDALEYARTAYRSADLQKTLLVNDHAAQTLFGDPLENMALGPGSEGSLSPGADHRYRYRLRGGKCVQDITILV